MGAQTRTDVLPYISLIPVFGYLWPGTSRAREGGGTQTRTEKLSFGFTDPDGRKGEGERREPF